MELKKTKDLIGQNLPNLNVSTMFAIGTSDDGKGFNYKELYIDKSLAEVVKAQNQGSFYSDIKEVPVLTVNKIIIVIGSDEDFELVDEINKLANVKARAMEKLLPEERRLFGLPNPEDLVSKD